jgi:signal transduction histidine kinase
VTRDLLLEEEETREPLQYVHHVSRLSAYVRRHALDVLIVVAALAAALEVALRRDSPDAPDVPLWFSIPTVALIVLPLLLRRRFPFAAPAALWLVSAALSFVDGQLAVFPAAPLIAGMAAAFLLGNIRDVTEARAGLAVVLVGSAIIVSNDPQRTPSEFVFTPLLFAIAWLAGFVLNRRGAEVEAAEQRAAQAERERAAAARVAVAEERARIARELHDIVAHSVSVMVLQVGAVRHQLPESQAENREALLGVEQTGRAALAEMRRLLGAMRHDDQELELTPQPGLEDLTSLLEEVGRAGLPGQLHIDGDPYPLPRALDLSAYRIIQEGLTNALKHARASRADVTVRYGAHDLQIEVRDDGTGPAPSDGLGHGLVGVRERVKIYGGEMTTDSPREGGFVLRTRLPFTGERV